MRTIPGDPYPWPFDGDLTPQNTTLIIIDMQTDFCGKGGYIDLMGYDINVSRACIAPIQRVLEVNSKSVQRRLVRARSRLRGHHAATQLQHHLLPDVLVGGCGLIRIEILQSQPAALHPIAVAAGAILLDDRIGVDRWRRGRRRARGSRRRGRLHR